MRETMGTNPPAPGKEQNMTQEEFEEQGRIKVSVPSLFRLVILGQFTAAPWRNGAYPRSCGDRSGWDAGRRAYKFLL